jgi:hypothetical protein
MPYAPKKSRLAWEDRFRTPSLSDLRGHYNKQQSALLDAARDRLLEFPGISEELTWQGLPWRWTLTYRCAAEPARVWAYLVPDPERPVLSMPLTSSTISALPMHRLKKHVKDGVTQSRLVNGVFWATWELTSKPQLAEVLELVDKKHALISRAN